METSTGDTDVICVWQMFCVKPYITSIQVGETALKAKKVDFQYYHDDARGGHRYRDHRNSSDHVIVIF